MYSILRAVMLTFFLSGSLTIGIWAKTHSLPYFTLHNKEILFLALILCITLPFSIHQFEFFGMGQDQGVYQVKAIELLYGNNQRVFDFEEYNELDEEKQEEFYSYIKRNAGYDILDSRCHFISENMGSKVAGIFHGIPTWPSILALFAKLFGLAHMQSCQTIFWILALLLSFFILENINTKSSYEFISIMILGLSPQIIWVAKSALTEMLLTTIIACYFCLLTEKNKKMRGFSCIPIIAFCFYHVSIYTMIPMFLLMYWGLYCITEEKSYIRACSISICAYLVGFVFMAYISPTYTTNNYIRPLAFLKFVNEHTIFFLVFIASITAFIITGTLPMIRQKYIKVGFSLTEHKSLYVKTIVCILIAIFFIRGISFILEGKNGSGNENDIGNLTLISMMLATGGIMLPLVLVDILSRSKEKLVGTNCYIVCFSFIYAVIVFSVLLRLNTRYYFYYGRYLVPYLFIIVVAFCYFYNNYKISYFVIPLLAGMFILFYPADLWLYNKLDDTRVEFSTLEAILQTVSGENNAVIIDTDIDRAFVLPVKATGASIFHKWEDFEEEIEYLEGKYENIYFISSDTLLNYNCSKLVNTLKNKGWSDTALKEQPLTKYPTGYEMLENKLQVYRLCPAKDIYNFTENNLITDGFENYKQDATFQWSIRETCTLECYLDKKDYKVEITSGLGIPLNELGMEQYKVKAFMNNHYIGTITYEKDTDNAFKKFIIHIPSNYIYEGINHLSFKSQLWSPSEYGSKDTRSLGISLSEIKFLNE